MQDLIRNTSKIRALITNQTLVLRSNAFFSSSAFPGSSDFEMERNFRPMNSVRGIEQDGRNTPGGARNFEMERNSRPMNFVRGIMEQDRRNIPGGARDFEMGRNSRSMNFVRGIIEQDGRYIPGSAQFPRYTIEQNPDIVHIKLIRNNAFVTVTDSKGNKKIGASSGCLSEMKGGPKLSRYAADATAEHVGRLARNLGLKSVVMKVKGFTYFKKKKQAIMSWKEGFNSSRGDENPIMYIEDTTRRPHNGCRLPRKRRV